MRKHSSEVSVARCRPMISLELWKLYIHHRLRKSCWDLITISGCIKWTALFQLSSWHVKECTLHVKMFCARQQKNTFKYLSNNMPTSHYSDIHPSYLQLFKIYSISVEIWQAWLESTSWIYQCCNAIFYCSFLFCAWHCVICNLIYMIFYCLFFLCAWHCVICNLISAASKDSWRFQAIYIRKGYITCPWRNDSFYIGIKHNNLTLSTFSMCITVTEWGAGCKEAEIIDVQ